MSLCPNCNGKLRMVLPQIDRQDAVLQCAGCGAVVIMDAQPSAPANLPARPMEGILVNRPKPTPVWLN